jgi:putative Mn2+ efflux pump MntP
MTNMNNLVLILAGTAGVLFHCLLKLRSLSEDARAANINFNAWKDYWKRDAVSIFLSFLSVAIWYMIFGEVGKKYPSILELKITSFVLMGMIGSYLIQFAMSKAKKKVREVIDAKTNELDPPGHKTTLTK